MVMDRMICQNRPASVLFTVPRVCTQVAWDTVSMLIEAIGAQNSQDLVALLCAGLAGASPIMRSAAVDALAKARGRSARLAV